MMKTVESYVRYSSHNQDDGYSVEYQTTEINEFCLRSGLELHKTHIDQAQTGTKVVGREAFFNLIERVKDGTVGVIVVYKLSRMFRNAYESQHYRKLFVKYGVKLMSVTQLIDEDSSAGRLMTNVLSDIDQYQSETTSDHVKSSMREMARQGYYTGGGVLYGFCLEIITHGTKIRKKLKILEKEAVVVRKIFQMFADNCTITYIQDYLSDNKIYKSNGSEFSVSNISKILKREAYIGTHRFQTSGYDDIVLKNCFPAIIDIDIWNIVQEKNIENKAKIKPLRPRRQRDEKKVYGLTGLVKCNSCGENYTGYSSGTSKNKIAAPEYSYYACRTKRNRRKCKGLNIRKERLESVVLKAVVNNILNEEAIARLSKEVAGLVESRPNDIEEEIKNLVKQKIKLEKRVDDLLEMRLNGEMTAAVLINKSASVEAELKEIKNRLLGYTEQKRTAISEKTVETYLREMFAHLNNMNDEIMRTIFEAFVEEVVIKDISIDVFLKVSPHKVSAYSSVVAPPFVGLYAKTLR